MLAVELAPRALRDLKQLPAETAASILHDLEALRTYPWPGPPKVKKIQGTPYLRLRTGDFRTIFERHSQRVLAIRVVARKDLERALRNL